MVGQSLIKKRLEKQLTQGMFRHAYLFHGAAGLGKYSFAMAFAQALLCERASAPQGVSRGIAADSVVEAGSSAFIADAAVTNSEFGAVDQGPVIPCHRCMTCRLFEGGTADDFLLLEPQQGKSISVGDVRLISEWVSIRPVYAKKKVYVIRNADKMTVQAQNALLKTLEEPPPYVTAILTASNTEVLLDTIKSRCMMIQFSRYSTEDIDALLTGETELSADKRKFLAAVSGGIPGKALELCSSRDFFELREETIALFAEFMHGDAVAGYRLTEFFESNREAFEDVIDIAISWLRDLWIYAVGGGAEQRTNLDKDEVTRSCRDAVNAQALLEMIEVLDGMKTSVSANANYTLAVNAMLFQINTLREAV